MINRFEVFKAELAKEVKGLGFGTVQIVLMKDYPVYEIKISSDSDNFRIINVSQEAVESSDLKTLIKDICDYIKKNFLNVDKEWGYWEGL